MGYITSPLRVGFWFPKVLVNQDEVQSDCGHQGDDGKYLNGVHHRHTYRTHGDRICY